MVGWLENVICDLRLAVLFAPPIVQHISQKAIFIIISIIIITLTVIKAFAFCHISMGLIRALRFKEANLIKIC